MTQYRYRAIEGTVLRYLKAFPVVGITGPRQSGKSTLLLHLLRDNYTYVNFDDYQIVNFYNDDPVQFIKNYSNKVIFDEVQKVPDIFSQIKMAVDKDRSYGRFVLTGSCQFTLLKSISESLAGRMGLLHLLPFQYSELPSYAKDEAIYKGSYPELVNRHYDYAREWFGAYLDTYLDKDIRLTFNIGDLRDFRRFVSLLAANVGSLLNLSRFANDLGVAVNTIKRWLSILEATYVVFLLPPYHGNSGKRLVKSPKVYFYDSGLVAYLTGVFSHEAYAQGPMSGRLFENYIVSEVMKCKHHFHKEVELYFYRTSHGVEVDLVMVHSKGKDWIEIKSGATFKPSMTRVLKDMLKEGDQGFLVYNGEDLSHTEPIRVLNYKSFLKTQSVPMIE